MTGKRLVCSECLTEACFAGVLMCDGARTASVIEVPAEDEPSMAERFGITEEDLAESDAWRETQP